MACHELYCDVPSGVVDQVANWVGAKAGLRKDLPARVAIDTRLQLPGANKALTTITVPFSEGGGAVSGDQPESGTRDRGGSQQLRHASSFRHRELSISPPSPSHTAHKLRAAPRLSKRRS
jgi:hypothetical protein